MGRLARYNENMGTPRDELEELCAQYGLRLVYAFGSRAEEMRSFLNGEKRSPSLSASDVDIAVLSDAHLTVEQKVQLGLALETILDAPRVDLLALDEADPFLAANVIRGERLYARDSYEADEYDLYVLRRAGDLAGLERERMALVLGEEPSKYDAG